MSSESARSIVCENRMQRCKFDASIRKGVVCGTTAALVVAVVDYFRHGQTCRPAGLQAGCFATKFMSVRSESESENLVDDRRVAILLL